MLRVLVLLSVTMVLTLLLPTLGGSYSFANVTIVGTLNVTIPPGNRITGHELLVTLGQGGTDEKFRLFRFLSVPYAEPPVGWLRFADPVPLDFTRPDGVQISATQPATPCPRRGRPDLVLSEREEDCLYLSVRSPDLNGSRPVLAVLADPDSDISARSGDVFAAVESVVMVTIAHRVGVLGYYGTNNSGLKDQRVALSLVENIIKYFGGDPSQVALAGHGTDASALVGMHAIGAVMSLKFQRVIMLGGSIFSPLAWSDETNAATKLAERFAAHTRCTSATDLGCLQKLTLTSTLEAEASLSSGGIRFAPLFEGAKPIELWRSGSFNGSAMIGIAADVGLAALAGVNFSENAENTFNRLIDREFRNYPRLHSDLSVSGRQYLRLALTDWPHSAYGPSVRPSLARAVGDFRSVCPAWQAAADLSRVQGAQAFVFLHDVTDPTGALATDARYLLGEPLLLSDTESGAHRNLSRLMMKHLAEFVRGNAPSSDWPQLNTIDFGYMRFRVASSASDGAAAATPEQDGFGFGPGRCPLWSGELREANSLSRAHNLLVLSETQPATGPHSVATPPVTANTNAFRILSNYTIRILKFGFITGQTIESERGNKSSRFLGIPYAKPPTEKLRFNRPVELSLGSDSVHLAQNFRPVCMQPGPLPPGQRMSEDCLYLNVWTPMYGSKNVKDLPVIVFLHGGFFQSGSTADDRWSGSWLLDHHEVVVVTVAYRLGALGFLALQSNKGTVNNGLWDQELALRWIRTYIEKFGGGQSVTLMGVEAGAASVGYHLMRPEPLLLFQRAVLLTGSPLLPQYALPIARMRRLHENFTGPAYLNCSGQDTDQLLDCLRGLNASVIIAKQAEFQRDLERGGWWPISAAFLPVVEDTSPANFSFFRSDPLTAGTPAAPVPTLVGSVDSPGNSLLDSIELRNLTHDQSLRLLRKSLKFFPRYPVELNSWSMIVAILRFTRFLHKPGAREFPERSAQVLAQALGNRFYTCPNWKHLAQTAAAPSGKPVYSFLLAEDRRTGRDGLLRGARLFEDAYYALGAPAAPSYPHGLARARLSEALMRSLVAFADTGDAGWDAYNASSRRIRLLTAADADPAAINQTAYYPDGLFAGSECAFWDRALPCVDSLACITQPLTTTTVATKSTESTGASSARTESTGVYTTTSDPGVGGGGLSTLALVLIVVVPLVGVLLAVGIYFLCRHHMLKRTVQSSPAHSDLKMGNFGASTASSTTGLNSGANFGSSANGAAMQNGLNNTKF